MKCISRQTFNEIVENKDLYRKQRRLLNILKKKYPYFISISAVKCICSRMKGFFLMCDLLTKKQTYLQTDTQDRLTK